MVASFMALATGLVCK
ncbi:hypothetical protein MTR67_047184 [Solanum verrucosum]|uniref:Uncharacterized protein n=1 Tax=Solanum verrucosum TaxID=315347 RepID=A0AAF0UY15_SOLVR|nr:hypothetical protein MTR67_047184 [Solanum verrucosum]